MLRTDSIYVWRVRLDVAEMAPPAAVKAIAAWRSVLSNAERSKADGFHRASHATDYVTAHVALRVVLGRCLGISPEKVRFVATGTSGAKPSLFAGKAGQVGQADLDVRFNLSHTAGAALIGVAIGREIGIDVEWHRPMDDLHGMATSVMSEQELRQWSALSAHDQTRAFFHLWTRKEAYLKAIGLGLYRSLQDVTVPLSANRLGPIPEGASIVRDRSGNGVWRVGDVPVAECYSASVSWDGDGIAGLVVRDLVREGEQWLW